MRKGRLDSWVKFRWKWLDATLDDGICPSLDVLNAWEHQVDNVIVLVYLTIVFIYIQVILIINNILLYNLLVVLHFHILSIIITTHPYDNSIPGKQDVFIVVLRALTARWIFLISHIYWVIPAELASINIVRWD